VAWIAVEDLIRKYLGNNMIVFFSKDFLALALYFSFFVARKVHFYEALQTAFFDLILSLLLVLRPSAFNPASTSIFYGLMGLKLCFSTHPFFSWAMPLSIPKRNCAAFSSLTGPHSRVAAFGIAQSILGHTFLNPEVIQEDIRSLSTL